MMPEIKLFGFFSRFTAVVLLACLLSSCAPSVTKPANSSGRTNGVAIGKGTRGGGVGVVGRQNLRRAAILKELERIRAQRNYGEVSLLGVKIPKLNLSFSQIAKGLQKSDDPVDKPTRPQPDLQFPTIDDVAPTEESQDSGDAILDERTLLLLSEAERMQSSLAEPLLSDLAKGSLSSEAFEKWSNDLRAEKQYHNVITALVIVCVFVLGISGYFLFTYILEEFRVSKLPTFGRK